MIEASESVVDLNEQQELIPLVENVDDLSVVEYCPKFRPISFYPDMVLRQVCQSVTEGEIHTLDIQRLCQDMVFTVQACHAYGLSAPQVHVLKRIIVLNVEQPLVLINPEIRDKSEKLTDGVYIEGCLSIPGYTTYIKRPEYVVVSFQDQQGDFQVIHTAGLVSICVQHEIDHLDGKLFIDYLSPLKRNIAVTKMKKTIKKLTRKVRERK